MVKKVLASFSLSGCASLIPIPLVLKTKTILFSTDIFLQIYDFRPQLSYRHYRHASGLWLVRTARRYGFLRLWTRGSNHHEHPTYHSKHAGWRSPPDRGNPKRWVALPVRSGTNGLPTRRSLTGRDLRDSAADQDHQASIRRGSPARVD